MEIKEKRVKKISVQGAINSIAVGGILDFPKKTYKASSIRSTASTVTLDTDKEFTVNTSRESETIRVTRTK